MSWYRLVFISNRGPLRILLIIIQLIICSFSFSFFAYMIYGKGPNHTFRLSNYILDDIWFNLCCMIPVIFHSKANIYRQQYRRMHHTSNKVYNYLKSFLICFTHWKSHYLTNSTEYNSQQWIWKIVTKYSYSKIYSNLICKIKSWVICRLIRFSLG